MDRAARAIQSADAHEGTYYGIDDADAATLARAVVKEMREPTEEMIRCGLEAMFCCDDGYEASMRAALGAIVDAALVKS